MLAGGTGGAKLAAGLQDVLGPGLSVVANTGDDIEIAGVDVSPDPDLVTYWLSGEIDEERGWGIKGDSFTVFDRLVQIGTPDWFRLSDRDLATCLYRKEFIAEGGRRTDAQAQIARALGVRAAVLPMSEERVHTRVRTADGWRDLQQYLVAEHAQAPVEGVEIEGLAAATPTPEVLAAIGDAEAIVVGPSNPVISIGPIVSMPAVREAISASAAPVIAVSPYVAGQVVKGPDGPVHESDRAPVDRRRGRISLPGASRRDDLRPRGPGSAPGGDPRHELSHVDGGPRGQARVGRADPRVRLDAGAQA